MVLVVFVVPVLWSVPVSFAVVVPLIVELLVPLVVSCVAPLFNVVVALVKYCPFVILARDVFERTPPAAISSTPETLPSSIAPVCGVS